MSSRPQASSHDTLALTFLLGFLTALGPLSTDLYLPSLPSIARHFGATSGHAQLTLSVYLFGFAIGLPFYGPLSDRKGRKKVLLVGVFIYGLANILAAFAPNLDTLIACRLLQGFGAAGPLVIARAIVRDLYEGPRAAQQLARMGSIMAIVPAIAPSFGVVLEHVAGWQASFVATAFLAGGLALWAYLRLPETLVERLLSPFRVSTILSGFGGLLQDRRFLPFGLLAATTHSGFFAFISGSSFVYQLHLGLSSFDFALAFTTVVLGYMGGSFTAQRIGMRHAAKRLMLIGTGFQATGGLAMLIGVLALPPSAWAFTLPMAIYAFGTGFSLPQAAANAMMPFPDRAGAVSSLLGMMQASVAAAVGAGVGAFIDRGPIVLAGTVAFFGLASLALYPVLRKN
ncbi:MAG: multidrug effflux MFS transporter [Proteobacteria bacterium]|nr:multidrug effflux MFS transporter [Pseudomonadota bacterium]